MTEEWRPIKEFDGYYEVSNLGRIRSLPRSVNMNANGVTARTIKGKILKTRLGKDGYVYIRMSYNGFRCMRRMSVLIWEAFSNVSRVGYEVDHIDNNRQNNRIDNLQLLTHRDNTNKGMLRKKKHSRYSGVTYQKSGNYERWISNITINGERKYLGSFQTEPEAGLAYHKALLTLGVVLTGGVVAVIGASN